MTPEDFESQLAQVNNSRLFDWEFLPNHFLVLDYRHWAFGFYINRSSIEIYFLCFELTLQ